MKCVVNGHVSLEFFCEFKREEKIAGIACYHAKYGHIRFNNLWKRVEGVICGVSIEELKIGLLACIGCLPDSTLVTKHPIKLLLQINHMKNTKPTLWILENTKTTTMDNVGLST